MEPVRSAYAVRAYRVERRKRNNMALAADENDPGMRAEYQQRAKQEARRAADLAEELSTLRDVLAGQVVWSVSLRTCWPQRTRWCSRCAPPTLTIWAEFSMPCVCASPCVEGRHQPSVSWTSPVSWGTFLL